MQFQVYGGFSLILINKYILATLWIINVCLCLYSMATAFGSGALFSLVGGMGTTNPVANAITSGVAFAVFQCGFFMVIIYKYLLVITVFSYFSVHSILSLTYHS